jgi:hypothetical protein
VPRRARSAFQQMIRATRTTHQVARRGTREYWPRVTGTESAPQTRSGIAWCRAIGY